MVLATPQLEQARLLRAWAEHDRARFPALRTTLELASISGARDAAAA